MVAEECAWMPTRHCGLWDMKMQAVADGIKKQYDINYVEFSPKDDDVIMWCGGTVDKEWGDGAAVYGWRTLIGADLDAMTHSNLINGLPPKECK
jgi:hypothetical protein